VTLHDSVLTVFSAYWKAAVNQKLRLLERIVSVVCTRNNYSANSRWCGISLVGKLFMRFQTDYLKWNFLQ